MKKYLCLVMLASVTQWGCEFLGGAAVGGLATGAGYEINSNRQMDRLEDDYRRGRMSREEYQDRKRQVERGSILYRSEERRVGKECRGRKSLYQEKKKKNRKT